jgi:Heterokaryon incompatibility protein (HET)
MSLFTVNEEGFREATLPAYEYSPLKDDLILHPCSGDKADPANHVKCDFNVRPLSSAEPYIAVKNARGYRKLQELIELDGKSLLVSAALERFLRHYRRSDQPVRLWVRYICLHKPDDHERERYWNPCMKNQLRWLT